MIDRNDDSYFDSYFDMSIHFWEQILLKCSSHWVLTLNQSDHDYICHSHARFECHSSNIVRDITIIAQVKFVKFEMQL